MATVAHDVDGDAGDRTREVSYDGQFRETPVRQWDSLATGDAQAGPAIVAGGESTVVVPPGWSLFVDERGTLHLEADR